MPQTRFVTKKALAWACAHRGGEQGGQARRQPRQGDQRRVRPVRQARRHRRAAGLPRGLRLGHQRLVVAGRGSARASSGAPTCRPRSNTILKHVPPNSGDPDAPLQLQISALDYSSFVGRIGVGRISQGTIKPGMDVLVMEGPMAAESVKGRRNQVLTFQGLDRVQVTEGRPGRHRADQRHCRHRHRRDRDRPANPAPLPMLKVDEPTLTMNFCVNTSPLAGAKASS